MAEQLANGRRIADLTTLSRSIVNRLATRASETNANGASRRRRNLPRVADVGFEQAVSRAVVMLGGESVLGLDLTSFAIVCELVTETIEARAGNGARRQRR